MAPFSNCFGRTALSANTWCKAPDLSSGCRFHVKQVMLTLPSPLWLGVVMPLYQPRILATILPQGEIKNEVDYRLEKKKKDSHGTEPMNSVHQPQRKH